MVAVREHVERGEMIEPSTVPSLARSSARSQTGWRVDRDTPCDFASGETTGGEIHERTTDARVAIGLDFSQDVGRSEASGEISVI